MIGQVCARASDVRRLLGYLFREGPAGEHGLSAPHTDAHLIAVWDGVDGLEPPRKAGGGRDLGLIGAASNVLLLAERRGKGDWRQARPVYHLAISAVSRKHTPTGHHTPDWGGCDHGGERLSSEQTASVRGRQPCRRAGAHTGREAMTSSCADRCSGLFGGDCSVVRAGCRSAPTHGAVTTYGGHMFLAQEAVNDPRDGMHRAVTLDLPGRQDTPENAAAYAGWQADAVARTLGALATGRPNPQIMLDEGACPGIPSWMGLRKHAIALHPLYVEPAVGEPLGGGLTMGDLEVPLPTGERPFEALARAIGERAADRVRAKYQALLTQPCTEQFRLMNVHCADASQIRWRAEASEVLARDAARSWSEPISMLSLACGAAGPVARLVDGLQSDGHRLEGMWLADRDPVALAAGRAIAGRHVDARLVRVTLLDLVDMSTGRASPLVAHFGLHGMHLVDILGLFEYLPDETAVSLLREVRKILRADGMILLANMLAERPDQDVFTHVIQWPSLFQRTPDELLLLITEAGFLESKVTLATDRPETAVYAVAAIRP